jgi:hypothetical protein
VTHLSRYSFAHQGKKLHEPDLLFAELLVDIYITGVNANDDQPKKARFRSPAYPVIPLGEAVEAARKMWETQRKFDAHIDSALKAIGYARHGASLRIIAALNHYGLANESGAKNDRKIRVSELAQDILVLQQSDPRRRKALKTAALSPAIHASLWERYGPHLPDDSAIRPYLIRDKGYSESIVEDVLANYRSTFEFANLDKLDDDNAVSESVTEDVTEAQAPRKSNTQPSDESQLKASISFTEQELPILVGPNRIARIPFPMTNDDFELLIGTLNLWKKRLIKDSERPDAES